MRNLLIIIFLLAGGDLRAAQQSFMEQAERATGELITEEGGCSGVVVGKVSQGYLFITAGHCVDEASGRMKVIIEDRYEVLEGSASESLTDDVAVMTIINRDGAIPAIIELGDERNEKWNASVAAVSYPVDIGKVSFPGYFLRPDLTNYPYWAQAYRWGHAMPVMVYAASGSSGSPVLSLTQEKVIGIIVAGSDGISMAIPASSIRQFLDGQTKRGKLFGHAPDPASNGFFHLPRK